MYCSFSFILVLDSWGKMPSGIIEGNFYELGAFDQCIGIEEPEKQFTAQYCLSQITRASEPEPPENSNATSNAFQQVVDGIMSRVSPQSRVVNSADP